MLLSRFALGDIQAAYDALILFAGVVVYQSFNMADKVKRMLAFFGKYSMDMFLTHTFLLTLWPSTHNIVYATRNPLVIYLTLLAMSLLLAMLLGKAKELIGFNRLIERLRK